MYDMFKDYQEIANETSANRTQDFDSPDIEMKSISERITRQEEQFKFNATLDLHDLTPASKPPRYLYYLKLLQCCYT